MKDTCGLSLEDAREAIPVAPKDEHLNGVSVECTDERALISASELIPLPNPLAEELLHRRSPSERHDTTSKL